LIELALVVREREVREKRFNLPERLRARDSLAAGGLKLPSSAWSGKSVIWLFLERLRMWREGRRRCAKEEARFELAGGGLCATSVFKP